MQTTVAQSSPEQATSGAGWSGSAEKTTPGKAPPVATTPGREGMTEKVTLMSPAESRSLIEALLRSEIYQEYERAFSEATGLVLSLRPVETWRLTHHGKRHESPFCSLMSETSRSCAACLQVQERLVAMAVEGARTINCFAGMSDTAVPIRLGNQVIGFLQTGQVFRKRPTRSQFAKVCQTLEQWGLQYDRRRLEEAFFKTRVLPPRQHESVVRLLTIFAQHLSMISNQVLLQQKNAEPPVITRAKEYILEHMAEDLSLARVAKAVNTSTFYFCKMFKKATGINFTDYLSRVRIEKAKNLLLNPNLRVSEIAFEVGFQSLTHFNRVFKKILGQSPTQYRAQLLGR
jgi:AraC-like DNA-binding protein/ligand-binding sensor protein